MASWVETQRNLYNREYKGNKPRTDSGASSNEDVPPAAAAALSPAEGKSPEEWADEMEKAATGAAMDMDVDTQVEAAAMEVVNEVTAAPPDDGGGKPAAITADETAAQGEVVDGKMPAKRLTQERKDLLEALGFVWSLRSKRTDDHWDEMYRQLVEYKEQNGVSEV